MSESIYLEINKSNYRIISSQLWIFFCYELLEHLNDKHIIDLVKEKTDDNFICFHIQTNENTEALLGVKSEDLTSNFIMMFSKDPAKLYSKFEYTGLRSIKSVLTRDKNRLATLYKADLGRLCVTIENTLKQKSQVNPNSPAVLSEEDQQEIEAVQAMYLFIMKSNFLHLEEDDVFLELLSEFLTDKSYASKTPYLKEVGYVANPQVLNDTFLTLSRMKDLVEYTVSVCSELLSSLNDGFYFESEETAIDLKKSFTYDSIFESMCFVRIKGKVIPMRVDNAVTELAIQMMNKSSNKLCIDKDTYEEISQYVQDLEVNKKYLTLEDIRLLSYWNRSNRICTAKEFKQICLANTRLLAFFASEGAVRSHMLTQEELDAVRADSYLDSKYDNFYKALYDHLDRAIVYSRLQQLDLQYKLFQNKNFIANLNTYNVYLYYLQLGGFRYDLDILNAIQTGDIPDNIQEPLHDYISIVYELEDKGLS